MYFKLVFCSQLSGSEEVNVHPATRTSHMTLPVRIESDVNIHALPLGKFTIKTIH